MSIIGSGGIRIDDDAAERDIKKLKSAISDLNECLKKIDLPVVIGHSSELDGRFYYAMQYERGMEWIKINKQKEALQDIIDDIEKLLDKYRMLDQEVKNDVNDLIDGIKNIKNILNV